MATSVFTCALCTLYFACFLNFFALAVTLVPTVGKICLTIGGTTTTINERTAFVTLTSYCLANLAKFLCAKYDTALSDYVGRKPVMVVSCMAFALRCLIVLTATTAGEFYAAAIVFGSLDVFYAVSIAFLADMLHGEERGKAIGIQTGLSVGMGFTVGVPVGAVLQQNFSISLPFYVAIASSCCSALFSLSIPHSDTVGIKHEDKKRSLPVSARGFLLEHNPFSGFALMRSASVSPLDWLTNYFGQIGQQLLQSVFLLFVQGALHYTPSEAGQAFAFVGVSIAIFSPLLIGRYEERPLVSWGMMLQICGYFFFSIAGTNLPGAALVAFPSYIGLAIGGVWMSAMPSILTKQYPISDYGAVVGVMAQQTVLAVVPAYPVSLYYAYSISPDAAVYWPGATWVFSAFFLMLAIFVQLRVHGERALVLKKRGLVGVAAVGPVPDPAAEADKNVDVSDLNVVVNPLMSVDAVPEAPAAEEVNQADKILL